MKTPVLHLFQKNVCTNLNVYQIKCSLDQDKRKLRYHISISVYYQTSRHRNSNQTLASKKNYNLAEHWRRKMTYLCNCEWL